MTDRDPRTGPRPPARPAFEFRTPPSALPALRPVAVTVSWALWVVAALAGLIAVVLPLLGVGDVQGGLLTIVERDFPAETAATRDRVVALAATVLIGGGMAAALLEAAFAVAMLSGRGGARIVLALLLVPAVLHALLLWGVASPATATCLGIGVATAVAASVVMFLPGTSAWFARQTRP